MGAIFSYSLVSGLLLLAMYPVYKWLMAGERQHGYNRLILYLVYASSLLLPAAVPSVRAFVDRIASPVSASVPAAEIEIGLPLVSVVEHEASLLPAVFLGLYLVGALLSLLFTILVMVRLISVISRGTRRSIGSYTLIITPSRGIAPFSWLRYIVMSRDDYESSGRVITVHELRHLALYHWVDLLIAQCVAIFQWYNPAAWLMREELKAVHEYQADEAVIASGADMRQYQMLLVKKAVGARFPSLANSLNHSKLKKRITMMYKSRSSVVRRMRAVALLPAAAAALCLTGVPFVATALSDASGASLVSGSSGKDSEIPVALQASTAGTVVSISSPSVSSSEQEQKASKPATTIIINGKEEAEKKDGAIAESSSSIYVNGKRVNSDPIIYVNGQRLDSSRSIAEISPDRIASVTVMKGEPEASIYIVLKDNAGTDGVETAETSSRATAQPVVIEEALTFKKNTGSTDGGGKAESQVLAVEKLPEFPGGSRAMMHWLGVNIVYPADAIASQTEGLVVVKFVVGKDGRIKDPEVIRSVSPSLDAEAVRVLLAMPEWTPGLIDGKPVDCYFTIPVAFKLTKDTPEQKEQ
ncbi:MAG: M56 family metallopeptidase [Duncaniella sp.]|nr:M56 family metallopeptidase [Duncaniella sp.]